MSPSPWRPAAVLVVGALLATVGVRAQRSLELRQPLALAVPAEIEGYHARDGALSAAEERAAGTTSYLVRSYVSTDSTRGTARSWFTLYVGYYDRQTRGQTIHSPKNCLPGAGWEPLTSQVAEIPTASGAVRVNRYLIQNGRQQALVLYWYQGRGRVAWNEYLVKWDLLRDSALRRRSDEALVRVMVPVTTTEADAFRRAAGAAAAIVQALAGALPA